MALLISGCSGPSEPRHAPAEQLAGTWRWVSSVDVQTQREHTPDSEGFTAILGMIATGPRQGTFTYVRTGAEEIMGSFGIGYEDFPANQFINIEPAIDFLRSAAWVGIGGDTLHLNGVFELGYHSRYVRVSPDGSSR